MPRMLAMSSIVSLPGSAEAIVVADSLGVVHDETLSGARYAMLDLKRRVLVCSGYSAFR